MGIEPKVVFKHSSKYDRTGLYVLQDKRIGLLKPVYISKGSTHADWNREIIFYKDGGDFDKFLWACISLVSYFYVHLIYTIAHMENL